MTDLTNSGESNRQETGKLDGNRTKGLAMIAEAKELVLLIGLGQAFKNSGRGGMRLESRMWGFCTKTVGCECLKRSRQCLGTKCFMVASFAIWLQGVMAS